MTKTDVGHRLAPIKLGQSEMALLIDNRALSKLSQGITTEITGEGGSIAPLNDAIIQSDRRGFEHFNVATQFACDSSCNSRLLYIQFYDYRFLNNPGSVDAQAFCSIGGRLHAAA